ncbi:hypothetical protein FBEOM_14095 [Fusarium beomiforme]|uniref:C2H2-type domain-containing protein n=1 Tax=Fusarium beomiforme TaxID=44412 RepID=A0A9P5DRH1_9HYPO|nr:hypothetical protein FBEOM_14095 [Fusarium beomiforme]
MQRARPSSSAASQDRPYPCIIAEKFPDKCSKSFVNIEKLNEHIKRCHSPVLWCNDCFKKFNSSLSDNVLQREKEYHKDLCPGQPSQKNRDLRAKSYVIDEERYERYKKLGWKKTDVKHELNERGGKEIVSKRSWRQIRETLFPSDAVAVDESHELVARVEREPRKQIFLTQFRDAPVPTQIEINPNFRPFPTADNTSHQSTILSEVTAPLTGPTTIAFSDPGPGRDDTIKLYSGEMAQMDYLNVPTLTIQEQGTSASLTGAGQWDTGNSGMFNLDQEIILESSYWFDNYVQNDMEEET